MSGRLGLEEVSAWAPDRWDELAVRSPAGHAFQSHAWGELKRALGWTPRRYLFRAGGEVVAVASLQERPALPVLAGLPLLPSRLLYAPRGPILLRPDPEAARAALDGLGAVARERAALILTVDPAWEEDGPLAATFAPAGFRPADREIQVSRTATIVPLHPAEEDQHRLLGASTANLINRARRLGIVARQVDLADPVSREEPLAAFHALLAGTGDRRGFVVRAEGYLLDQWRRLGEARLAHLWFAVHDGRPVAGMLLLTCGRRLVLFQAGSDPGPGIPRAEANRYLHWAVIRWAAANGYAELDLGGVDTPTAPGLPDGPGHPLWSLYQFKRSFGARGVSYVRAHERPANRLVAVAWRLARRARAGRGRVTPGAPGGPAGSTPGSTPGRADPTG